MPGWRFSLSDSLDMSMTCAPASFSSSCALLSFSWGFLVNAFTLLVSSLTEYGLKLNVPRIHTGSLAYRNKMTGKASVSCCVLTTYPSDNKRYLDLTPLSISLSSFPVCSHVRSKSRLDYITVTSPLTTSLTSTLQRSIETRTKTISQAISLLTCPEHHIPFPR